MYIDTYRTYARLHNAGMPAEQARIFVEILSEFVAGLSVEREQCAATALRAETDMRAAAEDRAHKEEIACMKAATAKKQWWTKVMSTAYISAMVICLVLLVFMPPR